MALIDGRYTLEETGQSGFLVSPRPCGACKHVYVVAAAVVVVVDVLVGGGRVANAENGSCPARTTK